MFVIIRSPNLGRFFPNGVIPVSMGFLNTNFTLIIAQNFVNDRDKFAKTKLGFTSLNLFVLCKPDAKK